MIVSRRSFVAAGIAMSVGFVLPRAAVAQRKGRGPIRKRPPLSGVYTLRLSDEIDMTFKEIKPSGPFRMGSLDQGPGEKSHWVLITRPFYMSVTEVTQGQYWTLMRKNPSDFSPNGRISDRIDWTQADWRLYPCENLSWFDAAEFCNALSILAKLKPFYRIERLGGGDIRVEIAAPPFKGDGYRLPTEAEWEYACRAGNPGAYCFGNDVSLLESYAWFAKDENSGMTSPVMATPTGEPRIDNAFGLWDMHGNVWEWCWDGYHAQYYTTLGQSSEKKPIVDPLGPDRIEGRVIRGGSWWTNYKYTLKDNQNFLRSAFRAPRSPSHHDYAIGFRVARTLPETH